MPDLIAMHTIEQHNARAGRYWFTPDTMRFFRSRVGGYGYVAAADPTVAFFVSSERGPDNVRRYSVRVAWHLGEDIDTVGTFQGYATRSGADRAAQRLASAAAPHDWPEDVRTMWLRPRAASYAAGYNDASARELRAATEASTRRQHLAHGRGPFRIGDYAIEEVTA